MDYLLAFGITSVWIVLLSSYGLRNTYVPYTLGAFYTDWIVLLSNSCLLPLTSFSSSSPASALLLFFYFGKFWGLGCVPFITICTWDRGICSGVSTVYYERTSAWPRACGTWLGPPPIIYWVVAWLLRCRGWFRPSWARSGLEAIIWPACCACCGIARG